MPEVDKAPDSVRFGPFELSVKTGELRKNGARLTLAGQPIQVLIRLVKTPGELVTREELQGCLWAGKDYGDFEKGLNAAVNRLREKLNDSATEPKYIETVPGRGYRFIARVLDRTDVVGPGKTVSHYRISEIVGSGGMGVVYKAQDLNLGRYVALKFLPDELATNHEALERFRREASTASSLNHPNICTIYEIGEHEGQPFIVMELLQGQTLREWLTLSALLRKPYEFVVDTGQLLDIALQIVDGLQTAHEKGVVHRDIKPTNIFVTRYGLVKILDFGLAKLIGTVNRSELETESALTALNVGSLPPRLSEIGAAIGTAGYMAPEQARGEDLDARADLFSFGLVLYEMATGRPAFNETTAAELCRAVLTKTPVPIHELNPSVPPTLEQVINKALDKNRELRYQSATELRADLDRVKHDVELGKVSALDVQQERRFLEAAAPREAQVGRSIEVMAMVRENESTGGLREFLRSEEAPHLAAEDVRERSFDVEFPRDERAKPQPLDVTLRLESPGFDPQRQMKKLRVPPRGDSQACTFFIIPRVVGQLVVNLELLNIHEQVLASRSIRTHALPAGAETSPDQVVVTIPLTLVVRRIEDRVVEMAVAAPTDTLSPGVESPTDLLLDKILSEGSVTEAPSGLLMKAFCSGLGDEASTRDVELIGTDFSHYRLLDVISNWGGKGIVYKAEDQKGGRQVALFFPRGEADDPLRLQALQEILGELHEYEGQRFIILDLVVPSSAQSSGPQEYTQFLNSDPGPDMASGASETLKTDAREQVGSAQIFDDEALRKGYLIGKDFSHYRLLGVSCWDRFSATYIAQDMKSRAKVVLRFLGEVRSNFPLRPDKHEYDPSLVREHEGVRYVVTDYHPAPGAAGRPDVGALLKEKGGITVGDGGSPSGSAYIPTISAPPTISVRDHGVPRETSPKPRKMLLILTSFVVVLITGVLFKTRLAHWPARSTASPQNQLSRGGTIVFGGFTNSTGDTAFDGLDPSGYQDSHLKAVPPPPSQVQFLSPDQVRQVLTQMNRNPDEQLSPSLAREVCLRANAYAVVTGSISVNGSGYKIIATAMNCQTGQTLGTAEGEVAKVAAASTDVKRAYVSMASRDVVEQLFQNLRKQQK